MLQSAVSLTSGIAFEHPADRTAELGGRPGEIRFLEVAPVRAVMVDGDGQPGDATFGARMPGLYATAYGLHFALKRRGVEVRVGMLEGLYWMADGSTDFDAILGPDRDTWRWTLLIALPSGSRSGSSTSPHRPLAVPWRAPQAADSRELGWPRPNLSY
jgi:hypothetical protein